MYLNHNILLAALFLATSACGSEIDHCVSDLSKECTPLYEPTFDNVYKFTLTPKCALGGTSCHGSGGALGGMVLQGGPDLAYEALLNPSNDAPRVFPGDVPCSHITAHLESTEPGFAMPPGKQLSEEERCAIYQWIADGALRGEGGDEGE